MKIMEYIFSIYGAFGLGIMIISAMLSLFVLAAFFVEMKSVRSKHSAADYVKKNSLVILERKDSFSYTTTTKHPRAKNNDDSFDSFGGCSFNNPFDNPF